MMLILILRFKLTIHKKKLHNQIIIENNQFNLLGYFRSRILYKVTHISPHLLNLTSSNAFWNFSLSVV